MSKRRRTSSGFSTKRPIDKQLISLNVDGLTATENETTLLTPPSACTVVGLRWDMSVHADAGVSGTLGNFAWAIVKVDDGNAANGLTLSSGSSFYTPEQDVLAFGQAPQVSTAGPPQHISGNTKTMRKMRLGDTIIFVAKGQATNTTSIRGVVQLFCKS